MKKIFRLFMIPILLFILVSCDKKSELITDSTKKDIITVDYESLNYIKQTRNIPFSDEKIEKIERNCYEKYAISKNVSNEQKEEYRKAIALSDYYCDVGNYHYCIVYLSMPIFPNVSPNNNIKDLVESKMYIPNTTYYKTNDFTLWMNFGYCYNYIQILVNKDTLEVRFDFDNPTSDELRLIVKKNTEHFKDLYDLFSYSSRSDLNFEDELERKSLTKELINENHFELYVSSSSTYDLASLFINVDCSITHISTKYYTNQYKIISNGNLTLYDLYKMCYENKNLFSLYLDNEITMVPCN